MNYFPHWLLGHDNECHIQHLLKKLRLKVIYLFWWAVANGSYKSAWTNVKSGVYRDQSWALFYFLCNDLPSTLVYYLQVMQACSQDTWKGDSLNSIRCGLYCTNRLTARKHLLNIACMHFVYGYSKCTVIYWTLDTRNYLLLFLQLIIITITMLRYIMCVWSAIYILCSIVMVHSSSTMLPINPHMKK